VEAAPLDVSVLAHLGWHYFITRQYDQALEPIRKALEIDPVHPLPLTILGGVYTQKGMYAEAIAARLKAISYSKGSANLLGALAHAYAIAGQRSDAERILHQLKELTKQQYVSAYSFAEAYTGLGQKDRAMEWLEKAYEENSGQMIYLKLQPSMDPLRSDARFQSLLRRMGL
jgi:tetratricopeptide (TPR) repeat protein